MGVSVLIHDVPSNTRIISQSLISVCSPNPQVKSRARESDESEVKVDLNKASVKVSGSKSVMNTQQLAAERERGGGGG